MILLLLALQDTVAGTAHPTLLDIPFDLAKPPPSSPGPGDIVVTARRINQRLPPLAEVRDDLLPRVETGLLGGRAGIELESHDLPGGVTSKRIMLKWKLKF